MLPPDVAADFALLFKFYFSAAHTQHTHTNTHGASDACDTRTRRQSVSQCASDGQRLALLAADPPSADHQRHLWTAGRTRHWDVNKRRVPHASRRAPIASMAFVVAHSLGFGHERRAAAFPIRHTVERPRAEIQ